MRFRRQGSACSVAWLLLVFATLVASVASAQGTPPAKALIDQADAFEAKYAKALAKGNAAALEGRLDEYIHSLIDFVPEREKSAGDYWYLGNVLYSLDPKRSYSLHRKAYEKAPDDPHAILEWAMEQHRAGECEGALPLYAEYLRLAPAHQEIHALHAECLARTGAYKKAVEAWDKADHRSRHTSIDFAIFAIFGDTSPYVRRNELLGKIRAGDLDLYEELILLDLQWATDWWNVSVYEEGLEQDLASARRALKGQPERLRQLETLVAALGEDLSAADLEKTLETSRIILGDNATLPESTLVASELLALVLADDPKARLPFEKRFSNELRRRAKGGDTRALEILAYLAAQGGDDEELRKIDKLGWEQYGLENFAVSYTLGLSSKQTRKTAAAASKQFPDNPVLLMRMVELDRAEGRPVKPAQLAEIIRAEHASGLRLSLLMQGVRYSYVLKSLYYQLGESLQSK